MAFATAAQPDFQGAVPGQPEHKEILDAHYREALDHLKDAMVSGESAALAALGSYHAKGRGVPQDDVQAYAYYYADLLVTGSSLTSHIRSLLERHLTEEQLASAKEDAEYYAGFFRDSAQTQDD